MAVSHAGLLAAPVHYSAAEAVSSQNIVRHDENANLAVASPFAYHAGPAVAYHAAPVHYSSADAVSSQNINRHNQPQAIKYSAPFAKVAVSSPFAYHAAPAAVAYHAAPAAVAYHGAEEIVSKFSLSDLHILRIKYFYFKSNVNTDFKIYYLFAFFDKMFAQINISNWTKATA